MNRSTTSAFCACVAMLLAESALAQATAPMVKPPSAFDAARAFGTAPPAVKTIPAANPPASTTSVMATVPPVSQAVPVPNRQVITNPPPADRKCVRGSPNPSFAFKPQSWNASGVMDLGKVADLSSGHALMTIRATDDLQVRIEQLRCEQENINAKLDYLIANVPKNNAVTAMRP
jgi:hypothetical protein